MNNSDGSHEEMSRYLHCVSNSIFQSDLILLPRNVSVKPQYYVLDNPSHERYFTRLNSLAILVYNVYRDVLTTTKILRIKNLKPLYFLV